MRVYDDVNVSVVWVWECVLFELFEDVMDVEERERC